MPIAKTIASAARKLVLIMALLPDAAIVILQSVGGCRSLPSSLCCCGGGSANGRHYRKRAMSIRQRTGRVFVAAVYLAPDPHQEAVYFMRPLL